MEVAKKEEEAGEIQDLIKITAYNLLSNSLSRVGTITY